MKALTEYFVQKNVLFKQIEEVLPKQLGSRKKIGIYTGVGIDSNYYAIFIINGKSRFIRKNAEDLLALLGQLASYKEHNFKKKYLLIGSPLCSKAKAFLQDEDFKVFKNFQA